MSSTALRKRFLQQVVQTPRISVKELLSKAPPPPPQFTNNFTTDDLGPYYFAPFGSDVTQPALQLDKELDELIEQSNQFLLNKPRQVVAEAKAQKLPTFDWPTYYENLDKEFVDKAKALEQEATKQREVLLTELEERVKESESLTERAVQDIPSVKFESEADIEAYEHFRQKTGPNAALDGLEVFGDALYEQLEAINTFADNYSVELQKTIDELSVECGKAVHVTINQIMSENPDFEEIITRKVKNDYFNVQRPESDYEKDDEEFEKLKKTNHWKWIPREEHH